jgi:hypothetical protein
LRYIWREISTGGKVGENRRIIRREEDRGKGNRKGKK